MEYKDGDRRTMQDNSFKKCEISSLKTWTKVDQKCRKNGLNLECHCGDKSCRLRGGKMSKVSGFVPRSNGQHRGDHKTRLPVSSPCERRTAGLELRSRAVGDTRPSQGSDPLRKGRRLSRGEKQESPPESRLNGKRSSECVSHNNNHGEGKTITHGPDDKMELQSLISLEKQQITDVPQAKTRCVRTSPSPSSLSSPSPSSQAGKVFHNSQHSETKMALGRALEEKAAKAAGKCLEQNGCCAIAGWKSSQEHSMSAKPLSTPLSNAAATSLQSGKSNTDNTGNMCRDSVASNTASVCPNATSRSSPLQGKGSSPAQSIVSPSGQTTARQPTERRWSTSTAASEQKSEPESIGCRWVGCTEQVDSGLLMEHISKTHVDTQLQGKSYVCKWEGCKVFNKPSCNKSWLERHILLHSGDKPFCCIVDGCGMRFPSQYGLERHVNSHFNTYQTSQQRPGRSRDDTPSKAFKKRKAKRKRPWQVKRVDYFDSRCLQQVRQELLSIAATAPPAGDREGASTTQQQQQQPTLTFHSSVIARRCDKSGQNQVLLHWQPPNILPDQWTLESQVACHQHRTIPLSLLPPGVPINNLLHFPFYQQHRFRKHRRK